MLPLAVQARTPIKAPHFDIYTDRSGTPVRVSVNMYRYASDVIIYIVAYIDIYLENSNQNNIYLCAVGNSVHA